MSGPFGIIATASDVPLDVAHAIRDQGRDVVVVTLKDITTADFSEFKTINHPIGALGHIINDLVDAGCRQVVWAGKLKRPSMASLKPDLRGAKIVAKLMTSGDDTALKTIRDEFAKDGLEIVDIGEIMPKLYADEGVICGQAPGSDVMATIALGREVLAVVSRFDMGQGAVLQGSRILALEGAEGTDEMLARSAKMIDADIGPAVYVKMLKTGQDLALDPPGIGENTIRIAAKAKISVIAVEAGGVIMVNKADIIKKAGQLGITIIGFEQDR
jgi:DUF1009 family protein